MGLELLAWMPNAAQLTTMVAVNPIKMSSGDLSVSMPTEEPHGQLTSQPPQMPHTDTTSTTPTPPTTAETTTTPATTHLQTRQIPLLQVPTNIKTEEPHPTHLQQHEQLTDQESGRVNC